MDCEDRVVGWMQNKNTTLSNAHKRYTLIILRRASVNYKLTLCYDGTRYNGWQKQGNTPNTIQEKIETVLEKSCGEKVELHG